MQSHVKLALQVCNYFCGYQNLVCVKRRVQDGKQRFKKYVKSNCSGRVLYALHTVVCGKLYKIQTKPHMN